ncbi:MAG: hypothetical protein ACI9VR_002017 [Cognaticolwellia sp.]|jgi:hypothetical protein
MMVVVSILSGITGIVSLVCWVMTLITMAQDSEEGGVGHAIGGFFCALYALVWGWKNRERNSRQTVMNAWMAAVVAGMVLNVVTALAS